ncbi:MAG: hypothetical protein GDA36_06320 [Rhodobacteraceae bacterium]|nr:hypothetical protein [Paracoccaceae bacterium]
MPLSPVGRFVLASPNYRAARHRGIGIPKHCSIPQAVFGYLPAPAFSPGSQGSMTGGFSHDPVTVATAQGIPVGLAGTSLVGQYPPARSPLRS